MELGEKLKQLRKAKKVNQSDISTYLKVDRSTYGKYETGDSEPDYEKLLKLATYFDVTTDFLLTNGYKNQHDSSVTLAAHRTDGYDKELPEEAKEELKNYIEYLKVKYKKKKG